MVAQRRMPKARGGRDAPPQLGASIWLAGTLMAAPLSIPLVNLLVIPVLGVATFTHIFHRLAADGSLSGALPVHPSEHIEIFDA